MQNRPSTGRACRLPRALALGVALASQALTAAEPAPAQADAADLAKQLSNPVSSLIAVPFQLNYDRSYGEDGYRFTLNVQPVYPVALNADWNLISRTILPLIHQDEVVGTDSETGTGDTLQSLFLSPQAPLGGWIVGFGPALLLPTASDDALGAEQWALGPTGVALRQNGPWTYGLLANHLWHVAGEDDRSDVDQSFLQPFVTYTTPGATTYALNAEAGYDWTGEQWSAPINAMVSQVTQLGQQLVSVQGGLRWWVETPDGGPEWGARLALTLLYPR